MSKRSEKLQEAVGAPAVKFPLYRSEHQRRIDEFMEKAGQELPADPILPDEKVRTLRARLILEEALETVVALGFMAHVEIIDTKEDGVEGKCHEVSLFEFGEPNLVEIADGCADISVVTIGTLSACGISDNALLEVVDVSNLAKFGPGGHRREDGKWIKPPDWVKPDIAGLLEQMKQN
jgi:predicted HAD superfamily Cof-like phosphohydrolase